jgi:hypothetical protein
MREGLNYNTKRKTTMSYPNNNNNSGVAYPTAPKKQRSPWFYVGMGCLGLFVLSLGTCVTIGAVGFNKIRNSEGYKKMQQEMSKPFDGEAIQKEMAGIPEYPGATLNETSTKAARMATGYMSMVLEKKKMSTAAYTVKEPPAEVVAWYEKKMPEAGYELANGSPGLKKFEIGTGNKMMTKTFINDTEMVQIQGQADSGKNVLLIMRFTGFTPKELQRVKK